MGSSANILIGPATLYIAGVDVGFTKDGVKVRNEREFVDIAADQLRGLVKKSKSMEKMFVGTTLLEATLTNIRLLWDQASGTNLGNNDDVTERAIKVVGTGPNSYVRTFTFERCVSISNAEINHSREEEVGLEAEFECLKTNAGPFGALVEVAPA